MDMIDLRYLVAAVEAGNFAKAANALGRNASTISRRIAHLEEELGLTLFERGHFGIRLTKGGKGVMIYVRRALAGFDAAMTAGRCYGEGEAGEIRLGVRMPPVGEPLRSILGIWRKENPGVVLTLYELNDAALFASLVERLLDIVLTTQHALPAHAVSSPFYRERLVVALPESHSLASRESVDWNVLRHETLLVQGWDESQSEREFYASRLGSGTEFKVHAVSKQGILALVGAGFGITFATASQAEVIFPGVIYRPISEADAWIEVCLAWNPQSEDAAVGRFLAFMRDAAQSRRLLAGA